MKMSGVGQGGSCFMTPHVSCIVLSLDDSRHTEVNFSAGWTGKLSLVKVESSYSLRGHTEDDSLTSPRANFGMFTSLVQCPMRLRPQSRGRKEWTPHLHYVTSCEVFWNSNTVLHPSRKTQGSLCILVTGANEG